MATRFKLLPISAAVLLLLGAGTSVSAGETTQEAISVATERSMTAESAAALSSSAAKVLRHIAEARGDLNAATPDTAKATAELDQADKLLDQIQTALPTTLVKDHVWVAKKHLEYEATSEVLPDLVPIDGSLDALVAYAPADQARDQLDQTKQALQKGDKAAATEHLKAVDEALVYAEADLPLHGTRMLIAQAKDDLGNGDTQSADQALKAAEDNVTFVSIGVDSPLAKAKTSLWYAWQNHLRGAQDRAKADLDAAGAALEQAAQSTDEMTRKAAADLVGEVRELHGLIESGAQSVSSRLERSWHRVEALSQRSADSIAIGWQRFLAGTQASKDLIDAKLRLADARIDYLDSEDVAAAKADLGQAQQDLQQATAQLKSDVKDKVQAISGLLTNLEQSLDGGTDVKNAQLAFQTAETKLTNLIRHL